MGQIWMKLPRICMKIKFDRLRYDMWLVMLQINRTALPIKGYRFISSQTIFSYNKIFIFFVSVVWEDYCLYFHLIIHLNVCLTHGVIIHVLCKERTVRIHIYPNYWCWYKYNQTFVNSMHGIWDKKNEGDICWICMMLAAEVRFK